MIRTSSPSPITATGPSAAMKAPYGIPDRLPTIMFCGLPVIVATLPRLLAVARAIRYGTGRSPRLPTIWITSGVSTRQTTSFTKNADRTPAEAITATSRPSGLRARDRPGGHEAEEPREVEVGGDDHHPEKEDQGRHVDGRHRLRQRQDAGDDHEPGADDGGARAVDAKARQHADREDEVGGEEDAARDKLAGRAGHRRWRRRSVARSASSRSSATSEWSAKHIAAAIARWPACSAIRRCICWQIRRYAGWPCGVVRSSIRCIASRAFMCM